LRLQPERIVNHADAEPLDSRYKLYEPVNAKLLVVQIGAMLVHPPGQPFASCFQGHGTRWVSARVSKAWENGARA